MTVNYLFAWVSEMRFADRKNRMDQRVMAVMNDGDFTFTRKNGESVLLSCIYDTQLELASGKVSSTDQRMIDASFEHGVFTVLGERVDRELIMGATVLTPQGDKAVGGVIYTDEMATVITLTIPGGDSLPPGEGLRWVK